MSIALNNHAQALYVFNILGEMDRNLEEWEDFIRPVVAAAVWLISQVLPFSLFQANRCLLQPPPASWGLQFII